MQDRAYDSLDGGQDGITANPPELHNLHALATRCGVSPEQLLPELYQSLRRMAHHQLKSEREGHSLNTTALVHEAWMKLAVSYPGLAFESERDFLALSGHLMRRVLIDHARQSGRQKRGAQMLQVTYTDSFEDAVDQLAADQLLAVDLALSRLSELDPRQVQIVELRYFAGFSLAETAELLALSPTSVKREWTMARAWLIAHLQDSQ